MFHFQELSMARYGGTQSVIRRHVWLMLLLLAAGGCGRSGTVSGKVKYKGHLLPSGQVVFFDSRDRQVGSASIGSDGSYTATLPSGTLKMAVITPPPSTLGSLSKEKSKVIVEGIKKMKKGAFNPLEGEGQDLPPTKSIPVPTKYSSPGESGLTLTVLGGPQSFDIDLQ
jgi:hypothetical protein